MCDEFYTRPIFFVEDVASSVNYYREKLGFRKSWGDEVFAQVERGGLEIMLGDKSLEPNPSVRSVLSMSLREPERLGELHQQFRTLGARIVSPPAEVSWQRGTLELKVEDLDGNILLFWGN